MGEKLERKPKWKNKCANYYNTYSALEERTLVCKIYSVDRANIPHYWVQYKCVIAM
jgi:hypothetical protein